MEARHIGEKDDIHAEIAHDDIRSIDHGEQMHIVYQAASRGNLRHITGGKSGEMNLYVFNNNIENIKAGFAKHGILHGARWNEFKPKHLVQPKPKEILAEKIKRYLLKTGPELIIKAVDGEKLRVSARKLKSDMGIEVGCRIYEKAKDLLRKQLEDGEWFGWDVSGHWYTMTLVP